MNKNTDTGTVYNIGKPEAGEAEAFVKQNWPEAKHEGVGYWRIPRKAHIFYNGNNHDDNGWFATITYVTMAQQRVIDAEWERERGIPRRVG